MKGLEVDVAVVVCVGVQDNVPENLNKNCLRKPGQIQDNICNLLRSQSFLGFPTCIPMIA